MTISFSALVVDTHPAAEGVQRRNLAAEVLPKLEEPNRPVLIRLYSHHPLVGNAVNVAQKWMELERPQEVEEVEDEAGRC